MNLLKRRAPRMICRYNKHLLSAFILLPFTAAWSGGQRAASPVKKELPVSGTNFYVSPSASDGDGSAGHPFGSLRAAQSAVRKLVAKRTLSADVTVWLHGGTYLLSQSFVLEASDSGTPDHQVTYRAVPGEVPRLIGGERLAPDSFKPVSDSAILSRLAPEARGHVLAARLSGEASHTNRYPDIFHGNGGLFNLIIDDHILPLSRWPNAGYTRMQTVINSGITPPAGGTFRYRPEVAEHARRWKVAAEEGELWLTGFWRVPFEVETVRVANINSDSGTITLAAPVPQGIGSKYTPLVGGTRHGNGNEQYYAMNLVEEIDRPGEWSFDFKTHTLYVWPVDEGGLQGHEVIVGGLNAPVVRLENTTDVHLQGLTIEGGTQEGIQVHNGVRNLIADCTVRNIGSGGIDVEGGVENRVQSCDLFHLGSYGIHLVSGDRKTLKPGGDVADNNHIAFIGEQDRITEGIYLDGVGNSATHNLIHDAPYNGIRYQGNDQTMAYNEIHHIGLDAGDLGIFYTNGDWAAQGNRVEHNFGHHSPNANGSYLDDGASGRTTVDNVFYKLASGIFIGGGHDNLAEGNLIVDCRIGIHIDDRGVSRHYDEHASHLTKFLRTIDPDQAPWSTRYPGFLKRIMLSPEEPTGNTVQANRIKGASTAYQIDPPAVVDAKTNPIVNGEVQIDLHSGIFQIGLNGTGADGSSRFDQVSVAGAGLHLDQFRTILPTNQQTGRDSDRGAGPLFDSNTDVKASNKSGKP